MMIRRAREGILRPEKTFSARSQIGFGPRETVIVSGRVTGRALLLRQNIRYAPGSDRRKRPGLVSSEFRGYRAVAAAPAEPKIMAPKLPPKGFDTFLRRLSAATPELSGGPRAGRDSRWAGAILKDPPIFVDWKPSAKPVHWIENLRTCAGARGRFERLMKAGPSFTTLIIAHSPGNGGSSLNTSIVCDGTTAFKIGFVGYPQGRNADATATIMARLASLQIWRRWAARGGGNQSPFGVRVVQNAHAHLMSGRRFLLPRSRKTCA